MKRGRPFRCQGRRDGGFTLIELSIVLVVVALLIAGIVVGKEMYTIAQTRSLISQMKDYELAYSAFKLKYNCLPGDCRNAASFGLGPNGNGDESIGAMTSTTSGVWSGGRSCAVISGTGWQCATNTARSATFIPYPWFELQQVFTHLGNSGFIKKTFDQMTSANNPGALVSGYTLTPESKVLDPYFPRAANGRNFIVAFMWNNRLYLRTGVAAVLSDGKPVFAGQGGSANYSEATLTAAQMKYIQDKLDYSPVGGQDASGYSNAAAAGQKVFATGLYTTGNPINVFQWQQGDGACFTSSGSSDLVPYQYNMNGYCDLLWQIN